MRLTSQHLLKLPKQGLLGDFRTRGSWRSRGAWGPWGAGEASLERQEGVRIPAGATATPALG